MTLKDAASNLGNVPDLPGAGEVEKAFAAFQGLQKTPAEPVDFPELGTWVEKCWSFRNRVEGTAAELSACRAVAVSAALHKEPASSDNLALVARLVASRWVQFLISEESSSRNFFLQEYRASDGTFYNKPEELQPKCLDDWPKGWGGKALPGLLHPEHLTVTELEIALAIFDWDQEGGSRPTSPHFVWWLRDRPAILWRIHAFLLKRYCFPLLGVFSAALGNTGQGRNGDHGSTTAQSLDRPPFRAGELWALYPRIGGLTVVGFLGVMSLDQLVAILFAAPWWVAAIAAFGGLGLLATLAYMDVFKQNRGVMASMPHGLPRVAHLVGLFAAWGLASAAVLSLSTLAWKALGPSDGAFVWFDGAGNPFGNLVVLAPPVGSWPRVLRFLVGLVGVASLSAALGALLQWVWEDKSATEPI
jgi:hypothetical protein